MKETLFSLRHYPNENMYFGRFFKFSKNNFFKIKKLSRPFAQNNVPNPIVEENLHYGYKLYQASGRVGRVTAYGFGGLWFDPSLRT